MTVPLIAKKPKKNMQGQNISRFDTEFNDGTFQTVKIFCIVHKNSAEF